MQKRPQTQKPIFLGLEPDKSKTFFIQKMKHGFHIFQIPDPMKCVLGPGDVVACLVCPICYRFVYRIENVPHTISDAP